MRDTGNPFQLLVSDAGAVNETEARHLSEVVVRVETSLEPRLVHGGDGAWWLEVDVPPVGEELRAVVQVNEIDDWPWLYETHVRDRLPSSIALAVTRPVTRR